MLPTNTEALPKGYIKTWANLKDMLVKISKGDIVEAKTDERGRIYLGTEYKNQNVEVAVLDTEGSEE